MKTKLHQYIGTVVGRGQWNGKGNRTDDPHDGAGDSSGFGQGNGTGRGRGSFDGLGGVMIGDPQGEGWGIGLGWSYPDGKGDG